MAKFIFGMNQSLDGYVDHEAFEPGVELFRHYIDQVRSTRASIYGRRMYEVMRYWDKDDPSWNADRCAFAQAWRAQQKWVVSKTLTSVGPNATLVKEDLSDFAQRLKEQESGEIRIAGPDLAHSLGELGMIDEYQIYLRPVVLGDGKPYFKAARPKLEFVASERVGEDALRLRYVPAEATSSSS